MQLNMRQKKRRQVYVRGMIHDIPILIRWIEMHFSICYLFLQGQTNEGLVSFTNKKHMYSFISQHISI